MLSAIQIDAAADLLATAFRSRTLLDEFPEALEPHGLEQAYAVQDALAHRLGLRAAGWKIGLTNAAAQRARGLAHPVRAHLFSDSVFTSPASVRGGWGRQMMEAEFVFEMACDLPGPGSRPYTIDQVRDSVACVYPAIEVCGSRLSAGTVPLEISVADNSNHNALVLGSPADNWRDIDLAGISLRIKADDHETVHGTGANVLGNPLLALHWLANALIGSGGLRQGDIVATGAAAVMPVGNAPIEAVADFGALGAVQVILGNTS